MLVAGAGIANAAAKNVILMISDGIGFNGWEAARYYEGSLPYDNGFDFYGCTTYMSGGSYDPVYIWDQFQNHMNGATDSAAAATALYTGQKTYSGAISRDLAGNDLTTIAETAASLGMATAAVTSVQYNHATPACVDAHNASRNNYGAIAADMITSDLDVIMGCDTKAPGAQIYADAAANGFTVVSDANLADWDDLTDGDSLFQGGPMPAKVFGGFNEPAGYLDGRAKPTLDQMTQAALAVLEQDPDGLFMMVEGGAVDWNNHGNDIALMIREQVDFDNACQSVIDWVNANDPNWDETIMIITADHECGSIWGPNAGTFDHVVDNGVGVLPGVSYNSGGHTNHLVPLWAKGVGADAFAGLVDGVDAQSAAFWGSQFYGWDGSYVDNTDVFTAMNNVIPEPASLALLSLGSLLVVRRRRA